MELLLLHTAVILGVGLGEHAGFPAGAICGPERQAGVPARKAEKRRHNFVEGLLLRIAQVRVRASESVCCARWMGCDPFVFALILVALALVSH